MKDHGTKAWLIICISLLANLVCAEEPKVWSRSFSWADHKDGPAVTLYDLDQGEAHLIGYFAYENYSKKNEIPRPAVLSGVKTADGAFWPDATVQVKNRQTGSWETIGKSTEQGERTDVTIAPNAINFDLKVNLDALKPLLNEHELARLILNSGEASEFELKYLVPPKPTDASP